MDQILLFDTLNMINASLNKRFEKEADLYISKQDEYEIKKHLCHGAYGAVIDMMKAHDISPDIILKVLIKCAGAMSLSKDRDIKMLIHDLAPVFDNVKYRSISYLIDDILNDAVYVQEKLKNYIFMRFVNGVKGGYCHNNIWPQYENILNEECLKSVFDVVVTTAKANDRSRTVNARWKFMIKAMIAHPSLLKDEQIIVKLKDSLEEADQNRLFRHLATELEEPTIEDDSYKSAVLFAYRSYGEAAFENAVSKLENRHQKNLKDLTKAVLFVFESEENPDIAKKMFKELGSLAQDEDTPKMVRNILNDRLWVKAQKKDYIYSSYKNLIDKGVAKRNIQDGQKKKDYNSYDDVKRDVLRATDDNAYTQIAFNWINMSSRQLKESLVDSFMDREKVPFIGKVYRALFVHGQKMSMAKLLKFCATASDAYMEYRDRAGSKYSSASECFDSYLLEYVMKYKLNSNESIIRYVNNIHFEKFAEFKK